MSFVRPLSKVLELNVWIVARNVVATAIFKIPLNIQNKSWPFQIFYEFFEFFANFSQFYFFVFLSYNNDQVVKNHLLDQTNSMARIKSARALRDKTRSSQNVKFANFFSIGWVWARFPRARTFSARHWICLIMKIIFDYWIVSVALKLAEIEAFQVIKKLNTFTPPMSRIDSW